MRDVKCVLRRWLMFGGLQARSCLFPGLLFLTFALSRHWKPFGIQRYDLILVCCLLIQYVLYRLKLETLDEIKTMSVFHGLGLTLELFKTHLGCWSYPEAALTKIYGVPLYSGFMYAAVASYLCQAWRLLDVRLVHWPKARTTMPLVAAIYLNFFTEHVLPDGRWLLAVLIVLVFVRTRVMYRVDGVNNRMPLSIAFLLIGFFMWIAENIATRLGAWQYPNQSSGWHLVHPEKISSWSLLVILTFILVAQLKHVKINRRSFCAASPKPVLPVRSTGRRRTRLKHQPR